MTLPDPAALQALHATLHHLVHELAEMKTFLLEIQEDVIAGFATFDADAVIVTDHEKRIKHLEKRDEGQ